MRGARDLVFVTFVMILMSPAFHLVPEALHDHAREASSRDVVCSDLCINEVMPNADGSDQGIFPGGEWVELLNSGSVDVSLEGWALVDLGGWHHPINSETWVGFDDLDSPF